MQPLKARLRVRKMLGCTWGRYNFVLPHGIVLHRYEVANEAEPFQTPALRA